MTVKRYRFDDREVEKLRASSSDLRASRTDMTREQFVNAVCANAGAGRVRFYSGATRD